MITIDNLTLTYPSGKGVFDLNFSVGKGEIMGYLGPNGAGKTTTIRALLGFMRPDKGSCSIDGLDCSINAPLIQETLGYIPGEITFIDDMSGYEFLKFMHNMRGTKSVERQKQLIEMFELDPSDKIKKFSKGMKQKLGIITAFMHNPKVLILDEPTSGLDPLMQNRFIELLLNEKAEGKTILMSSHLVEEVEKTCDNVLIIKDGRIIERTNVQNLKSSQRKVFIIRPSDINAAMKLFIKAELEASVHGDSIEVITSGENIDTFIKVSAKMNISSLDIKTQSLEDFFMHFYKREGK